MSEGVVRQRRNLLLVNIFILFTLLGNLQTDKIDFAGFSLDFTESSDALTYWAWGLWGWFLYRHLVYFLADVWGPYKKKVFYEGHNEIGRWLRRKIVKIYGKQDLKTPYRYETNYRFYRVNGYVHAGKLSHENRLNSKRKYKPLRIVIFLLLTKYKIRFLLLDKSTSDHLVPFGLSFAVFLFALIKTFYIAPLQ